MAMNSNLIYDLGMFNGKDTEFYLKKGFSVVAVEANPAMIEAVKVRLGHFIRSGQLQIIETAIYEAAGEVDFFVSESMPDWSSVHAHLVANAGPGCHAIKVKSQRLLGILEEYGCPYYLKSDLEGADMVALEDLSLIQDRPKYVSAELDDFALVRKAAEIGYRWFKLTNQEANRFARLPNPPLEGHYYHTVFDGQMSGPFGDEAPGQWTTFEDFARDYLSIEKIRTECPHLFPGIWFDFHAKL